VVIVCFYNKNGNFAYAILANWPF